MDALHRNDPLGPRAFKHGPKQYKSGKPGLAGRERLQRRVNGLLMAAHRFAEKEQGSADGQWAAALEARLRDESEADRQVRIFRYQNDARFHAVVSVLAHAEVSTADLGEALAVVKELRARR